MGFDALTLLDTQTLGILLLVNTKQVRFEPFLTCAQVDVHDYLTLVGCLEDRSQAFVIKRVGWLAAWNPCCPEGYMELGLDSREERQVAKVRFLLS